jgi:predicted nucleic acid-binding protein
VGTETADGKRKPGRTQAQTETSADQEFNPKDSLMRLLLDTSVLIDVLRLRRRRRELLAELASGGHTLATTALNVAELYAGMRPEEEKRTEEFLDVLDCYPLTAPAGRLAGILKYKYARKGRTLTLADSIVAAIAIERRCTLMTDNRKDFPMPELECFKLPEG